MSDLPAAMNAIQIGVPGPPESLWLASRPVPQPGPQEVLIRVAAAGINRPDVLQRKGLYPPPAGATDIPGLEVAGEVVRVGAGVTEPAVGARVCALVVGGGYAEYVVAPAVQCLPVPAALSLEEAAVLPETFFTVYYNVFMRARLSAGETLLIHGGSSGIGTTAILLAKAMGAPAIVTAGSAEKCAACRTLGAEVAINYKEEDFVARTLEATDGRGAEVILDMVGGDYLARNIAAAAVNGRIAVIATQGGVKAEIDLRSLMAKRLWLGGSTLRPQTVASKGEIAAALRREVWPLFESRSLRPVIHARFPLREAAQAHALMESGVHIGKIVLVA
ncbi:MAG TPA: NAD(P)H-quinone oxidoreductase [Steroidobacteraceae bacterium]|nr:NAD(P)H-quinone oxidoreductase [Steroidobacteraceae bacterium]